MSNQEFDIDKLRDYLLGKLSEEERSAFESRLNLDPEFKKEVVIHTALLAGIEHHFDRHLKHRLQKEERKLKINTKILMALAACISMILIASFVYFFDKPEDHELFTTYYKPYYNVISDYKRGNENTADRYNRAFQFYERKEYAEAIDKMNALLAENPSDQNLQFYLGLSHLALGKSEAASTHLQMVMQSDHKLAEPAAWYLGLSYLKADDRENAIMVFSKIAAANTSYSERAREILKKLE